MKSSSVYLAFGSNLGDKEANIRRAAQLVEERVGHVEALSSMLVTKPWGFSSDNDFVNAAARVVTTLPPHELLAATQEMEREMGRTLKSADGHYHDRTIDIDLLMYGGLRLDDADLKLPHPLMLQRDFVMIPLREVLDDSGLELIRRLRAGKL